MTSPNHKSLIGQPGGVPIRTPWSTDPVLEMRHVSAHYAEAQAPVLRDVDLTLEEGEILLVVGRTGAGKSTLLQAMTGAMPHTTGGTLGGSVRVVGRDTRDYPPRMLADAVGVVGQDPRAGFVADTVAEELAYGMEQQGVAPAVMRKRVEEIMDLLGIAELRHMPLRDLSGGEQQRVALGAVLTSRPALIVMDEPTSALDPNGAEDVLATVTRVAHDLGTTVVLAEHRIERVLQYADRVAHVGRDGRVQVGTPAQIMEIADVAPPVVELGRWARWSPLPLSIRDARRAGTELRRRLYTPLLEQDGGADGADGAEQQASGTVVLRARDVIVDVPGLRAVDTVSLELRAGEVTALMGRNGCGKSTLLWALQGTGMRTAGRVNTTSAVRPHTDPPSVDPARLSPHERRRCVGLVPQNPTDLLYESTVARELARSDADASPKTSMDMGMDAHTHAGMRGVTRAILDELAPGIPDTAHPRDLSEGQRLALALAIQLAAQPPVLLLDEPTRGLDYESKRALVASIRKKREEGTAVLVATHDVEFAAQCADRVQVMAAGQIVAAGAAVEILGSSPAYAPQVAKLTAGLHHEPRWLTVQDVVDACEGSGR